jgi:hypothetical protein
MRIHPDLRSAAAQLVSPQKTVMYSPPHSI